MATLLASLVSIVTGSPTQASEPAEYDLVLRNGRLLDGNGNPWVRADVAIKDGRFARVGLVEGHGKRELDIAGDYVSPGWIDSMDQSGAVLLRNGLADNKVRQGITSAIAGESGAPVGSAELPAYFSQLERQGISLNFGTYYGAAQARTEVMGQGSGTPTKEQQDAMAQHVRQAMQAGAMGISTALIYPPDSFQTTEDLVALARAAAEYGGIYASHLRDEGAGLLGAIRESIVIGERTGIRVEIHHFKAAYAAGFGKLMREAEATIAAARGRGVDIAANMYLYTAGGTDLSVTVPNWVFSDGDEVAVQRLKDPAIRTRLKKELEAGPEPGWSNLVFQIGGWDKVVLANANSDQFARFNNRSIANIARELKRDPADTAWDILLAAQPKSAHALFFMMDERDVEYALRLPWVSIGSDSGASGGPGQIDAGGLPHPRAYGNFPRLIAEYVRKRHLLTLEDAVRRMTSWPALRLRLSDRGAIHEGLKADVTVFNYDRIEDKATYGEPTAYPTGIDYVLVNGQFVVDQGQHTNATPGEILRGPGAGRTVR